LEENNTDTDKEQYRNASLYPILVCAIILILVGVILTIKREMAGWDFPVSSRLSGSAKPMVSGPACIVLGALMGIFPVFQLIKNARRTKD
jgi:hypothetical protein